MSKVPTDVVPAEDGARARIGGLLAQLLEWAEEKFPPNRLMILISPFLVAAAGSVTAAAAKYVPWLGLSKGQVTAVFIAGAAAMAAKLLSWLKGWREQEERRHWGNLPVPETDTSDEIVKALIAAGHHLELEPDGTIRFPTIESVPTVAAAPVPAFGTMVNPPPAAIPDPEFAVPPPPVPRPPVPPPAG